MISNSSILPASRKQKFILYLLIGLFAAGTLGLLPQMQSPEVITNSFLSEPCLETSLPEINHFNVVTAVPPCWLVR